jgi:hypothetical protein
MAFRLLSTWRASPNAAWVSLAGWRNRVDLGVIEKSLEMAGARGPVNNLYLLHQL